MEELKSLAEAAGYNVLASVEQITRPHGRYHIGSGKTQEIAKMATELGAEKIIFGNELKVKQVYNLASVTGIEVTDYFQLILEIFLRRASTREARLQIELAKWRYELANAREKVRLARISEQPGFLGLGKYQVDVYYEAVSRQVRNIQERLKRVKKTRELHRRRRRKLLFPLISMAGYTNSGKSTLFNALAEENVTVDSDVFTTLSTKTRIVALSRSKALLTDTVGFIDRLPLTLIDAFRSTLEEMVYSDLILLAVDVSESQPEIERKISCCLETIQEIGATGIPILIVLNKIDLLSEKALQDRVESLKDLSTNPVPISALYGMNLQSLKEEIEKRLMPYGRFFFSVPLSNESLSLLSWVYENADVKTAKYEETHMHVSFGSIPAIAERIRKDAENLGGIFQYDEPFSLDSKTKS